MLLVDVRRLRPIVLLALAAALVVPAGAGARRVPRGWMGVVATDTTLLRSPFTWAAETAKMAASGVETVRIPIYWMSTEPNRGSYDFGYLDYVVAGAADRGIRVQPTVLGTPAWATSNGASYNQPPKDPQDYARFLQVLIGRYGPDGAFWAAHPTLRKVPIEWWQVWNEPMLRQFWKPKRWAPGYVRLLAAARTAIRAADPTAKVVLAGLPNDAWNTLHDIHRAGGDGLYDIAAVHPYTSPPHRIIRLLLRARKELDADRGRRVGILVSEFGWSSGGRRAKVESYVTWNTSEADQARRVGQAYGEMARYRTRLKIVGAYWYSWLTPERGRSPHWEDYTGLRKRDAKGRIVSKPALKAYARTARRLER